MKRILIFLLAVLVLGGTGLAEAKRKAKVVTRSFTGTVLWADPIQNTIALKGGDDEVRFRVHTTTALKRRGKAVKLVKFIKGDRVTIVYRVERSTKIATAITL